MKYNHQPYNRARVRCIETGIIYESVSHAASVIGCGRSAICNQLEGRFPHVRGYTFERLAPNEKRKRRERV